MKKMYLAAVILVVPLVAVSMAQDVEEPVGTGDMVVEPVLNENQQLRVQRLSEASGVSEDEILQMRMRTPVPDDPTLTETETTETVGPQGRGWGLIAQLLGLHPGILGNGTGDKFLPPEDDTTGLLAARHSKRKNRLFGDDDSVGEKEKSGRPDSAGPKSDKSQGNGRDKDKSNQGKGKGKGRGKAKGEK